MNRLHLNSTGKISYKHKSMGWLVHYTLIIITAHVLTNNTECRRIAVYYFVKYRSTCILMG